MRFGPEFYLEGFGVVFTIVALSQLAAWFGGIFRALLGAIAILTSAFFFGLFIFVHAYCNLSVEVAADLFRVCGYLTALPMLIRYEFYAKEELMPKL